jgi:LemA protein
VRVYNTELRTLPGSIWASTIYRRYKPMETFTASAESQSPPPVKF